MKVKAIAESTPPAMAAMVAKTGGGDDAVKNAGVVARVATSVLSPSPPPVASRSYSRLENALQKHKAMRTARHLRAPSKAATLASSPRSNTEHRPRTPMVMHCLLTS